MRVKWIDVAKGIGIILVTVGHTNARHMFGDYVGNWINCFHMPLFFVMAGLCFDPSRYPSFVGYLKRKLVAIGWPFVALTAFMALLSIPLYWGDDPKMGFASQMLKLARLDSEVNTFWFLKTLFEVEIVYWLLARAINRNSILLAVALLIGTVGIFVVPEGWKPMQYNTLMASIGYYGLGACLHNTTQMRNSTLWLWGGLGLLLAYSIAVWLFFPYMAGYSCVKLGNPYLFVPLSITAIVGISLLSMWLAEIRFLGDALVWLGINSIVLMAIHGHCGMFAGSWARFGLAGADAKILEYSLFAALVWALAYPLNWIVNLPKFKPTWGGGNK